MDAIQTAYVIVLTVSYGVVIYALARIALIWCEQYGKLKAEKERLERIRREAKLNANLEEPF